MNTLGMGIGMWIFWIIVVVTVVLLVKLWIVGVPDRSDKTSESPLEILEKRYASGEVDEDEFKRIKKELDN